MAAEGARDGSRWLLGVVCLIFLAVGMSSGAVGPLLNDLARQAGSDVASAGGMVTAMFTASLVAQIVVALILRRLGQRPVLLTAMGIFIAGVSGIALAGSLSLLIGAAAVKGLGDSALLLVGTVIAAEASAGAGPLNLVNAMFGLGAILSPALVSLTMTRLGTGVPALWTVPVAMGLAFLLLLLWRPAASAAPASADPKAGAGDHLATLLRTPLFWKVAVFVVLEVATEVGISAWLPTMLSRATPLSLARGAMVMSLYWFVISVARFVAAWASAFVTPLVLLAATLTLCLAGGGLLVAGMALASPGLAILAVAVLGTAIGPLLPTALAILRAAYPADAGFATGLAFGSSNLGAAAVPPLMGALIVAAGPVVGSAALILPMLDMAASLVLIAREPPRNNPATKAAATGTGA